MTYTLKDNPNYAAEVVVVDRLIEFSELDNLRGVAAFGYQVLVSKDVSVGDRLVVFPAEAQLHPQLAKAFNLNRDATLNADPTAIGYLEKNLRVRAIRLRGIRSDALALNADQFEALYGPLPEPGVKFDTVGDFGLCRKYVVPVKASTQGGAKQEKVWRRVEDKYLPEHPDTEQYFRNRDRIPTDATIIVTQKLHGTSIRLGRTIVKRRLTWRDKIARILGVAVSDTEFDAVFGSRKVIKDPNNPNQNHFYSDGDIWTLNGQQYAAQIPENVVVYGELVGYTSSGGAIQSGYVYTAQPRTADLYVYRVAVVTRDAHVYDLSWDGVREFCAERGWKHVPELWRGPHADFVAEDWLDKRFADTYAQAVPLSGPKTVDEGVCIRRDGVNPLILKAKSSLFLLHETNSIDAGEVDIESESAV